MSNQQTSAIVQKKQRDSGLELYRIIVMLLIVAHHYVVNSGLFEATGPILSDPMSAKSLALLIFGAFGKTGINCFVLITGYFMCTSKITFKKFAKLFGEVIFYDVLFNAIFWLTGYAPFTIKSFVQNILPFTAISHNFTGCYIVFFLTIPFLNILVHKITQKQHLYLIALCSFTYIWMGTLPLHYVTMNYVSWYMVLYFIASYIRLYPAQIFSKKAFWGCATLVFAFLSAASVVVCTWAGVDSYYFVTDSNTLLAVLTGVSSFLFFKNLKIKYSPFINHVASTTFGVLLIHAANDSMRNWLWNDVLKNVEMYQSQYVLLHAVGSVLAVFIICSALDMLRIRFIEKPVFRLWDKHSQRFENRFSQIEKKICSKLNIATDQSSDA